MHNRRPAAGNGNSNARVLRTILAKNSAICSLDVSNTGLDNDGVEEICQVTRLLQLIEHCDWHFVLYIGTAAFCCCCRATTISLLQLLPL
jgi:hypothetical protein